MGLKVLKDVELSTFSTLTWQVLNPESDFTEDDKMRATARVLEEKTATVAAHRKAIPLKLPTGLDATQMFSGHVPQFFSVLSKNYSS